jgi:ribosomal protein S18 acetylase RimI-like enzyme
MQIPSIDIRHANLSDAPLLASLGAQTFSDAFAAENTPENLAAYLAASFIPAQLSAELSDPSILFLMAEIAGEAVGYAKLFSGQMPPEIIAPHPIELVRIYSTRAYFGRGVGPALMQACLDLATQRGFQSIWLGVWERNLRAQSFYRKWGFQIVGSHPVLLGADMESDYIMQRAL